MAMPENQYEFDGLWPNAVGEIGSELREQFPPISDIPAELLTILGQLAPESDDEEMA